MRLLSRNVFLLKSFTNNDQYEISKFCLALVETGRQGSPVASVLTSRIQKSRWPLWTYYSVTLSGCILVRLYAQGFLSSMSLKTGLGENPGG